MEVPSAIVLRLEYRSVVAKSHSLDMGVLQLVSFILVDRALGEGTFRIMAPWMAPPIGGAVSSRSFIIFLT